MKSLKNYLYEKESSTCQYMVHLIDKNGKKVTMPNSEWIKRQESINESEEIYEADMDWYLEHGTEANEVFKKIEEGYDSIK